MAKRGPKQNTVYLPTDENRRAAFLRALRESGGSFAAACRATAPHLSGDSANPPGYSTWRALMQRDPAFAAAVEETLQVVRDDIEAEMHRRSVVGVEVPQFQKAQRVIDHDGTPAVVRKYSDTILLKRAAALMPEKYAERKTVDINHNVSTSGAWTITALDLEALNSTEQAQLAAIMGKVRDHRKGVAAAIEHQPTDVIDANFSEVDQEAEVDPIPW